MLGTPPSPSHFDRLAAEIGGDLGGPGPVMDRFWAEIEGQLDTLSPEVLSVDTASAVCTAVRASGSGRSSSPAVRPASLPRPERRRRHRSLPAGLNKNLYDRMRESIKIFFQNTSFDCQACRTRRHQNRCLVCRCERPVRPCTCRPASGGDAALVPDGATWTCCPTCQPESCAGVSGLACEAEARVLGGLISCAHCAEESGADAVAESVRRLLLNMRDFLLDLARFVDATRTPCVATDEDRRCLAGHGLEATTTSGAAVTQAQVAYLRAAAGSFDAATYRALGRTPAPLQPGFVAASRRALVLRTYARPAGWTLLPPSICGTYDAAAQTYTLKVYNGKYQADASKRAGATVSFAVNLSNRKVTRVIGGQTLTVKFATNPDKSQVATFENERTLVPYDIPAVSLSKKEQKDNTADTSVKLRETFRGASSRGDAAGILPSSSRSLAAGRWWTVAAVALGLALLVLLLLRRRYGAR